MKRNSTFQRSLKCGAASPRWPIAIGMDLNTEKRDSLKMNERSKW